jgi:hypothetical protein
MGDVTGCEAVLGSCCAEARREERFEAAALPARARPRGRSPQNVAVVNISTTGCAIGHVTCLAVGGHVWLRLPGLESWEANVVWLDGERAGLQFKQPFHPAVVHRLISGTCNLRKAV